MREGTTSRVMAAGRQYGEFYFIFSASVRNILDTLSYSKISFPMGVGHTARMGQIIKVKAKFTLNRSRRPRGGVEV
jgi:hypothetical protein